MEDNIMANKDTIESRMSNLLDILISENETYHIPDFQREFVWTDDEVNELFDDFMEDTNNLSKETSELQGYLLGNIVLIRENNQYLVIDGQQRLTTLTLIFKALYENITKKINDSESKDTWLTSVGDINKAYQNKNDEGDFVSLKITHEPTLSFGKYYKFLVGPQSKDSEGQNMDLKPTTASDVNIDKVYTAINERIDSFDDLQLNRFIRYIRTKVMIIVTSAPSQSKAFQLFEVLNDRGRSLEPMDLVKNLLLKELNTAGFSDSDQREFMENWTKFITNLQISPKRNISSSTFMKHFILGMYAKNVKRENLFDFFKNFIGKGTSQRGMILKPNDIIPFSQKLAQVSETYQDIEKNPSHSSFGNSTNLFILFKLLKLKQFHPILIPFYNASDDIKYRISDAAVRLGIAVIFSFSQTNVLEKELPNILKGTLDSNLSLEQKADIVIEKINDLIKDFAPRIKPALSTRSFTSSNGSLQTKATDLLKVIELYVNQNTVIINPPRGKRITAEHILSQKLSINLEMYDFSDQKEKDYYMNRIGNITLLFNAENSGLGNSDFKDKIKGYQKSEFKVTKSIVSDIETSVKNGQTAKYVEVLNELQPTYATSETQIWSKEMIDRRSEDIAILLTKIVAK